MSSSIFAIAIRRRPAGVNVLREQLAEVGDGPIPIEALKARIFAVAPEVQWDELWNRAMGRFDDGTALEIVPLEDNGTLSLRPSRHRGKSLEIVLRFHRKQDEWALFGEDLSPWHPPR